MDNNDNHGKDSAQQPNLNSTINAITLALSIHDRVKNSVMSVDKVIMQNQKALLNLPDFSYSKEIISQEEEQRNVFKNYSLRGQLINNLIPIFTKMQMYNKEMRKRSKFFILLK